MSGTQLLELLVNAPSVSGREAELADLLVRMLSSEGFDVQREGDSIWFTLGASKRRIWFCLVISTLCHLAMGGLVILSSCALMAISCQVLAPTMRRVVSRP